MYKIRWKTKYTHSIQDIYICNFLKEILHNGGDVTVEGKASKESIACSIPTLQYKIKSTNKSLLTSHVSVSHDAKVEPATTCFILYSHLWNMWYYFSRKTAHGFGSS